MDRQQDLMLNAQEISLLSVSARGELPVVPAGAMPDKIRSQSAKIT